MENHRRPTEPELLATVAVARSIMPDVGIQVPPNLVPDFGPFLLAGADDLGGISPLTPDFINPGQPWPSITELQAAIRRAGFRPRERLPIYPRYVRDERFMSKEVRELVHEIADEEGYRAR
jgi:7,8-didemethyl-8-hydroxy-5-deazariboflavin synthase CofG subunit